MYFQYSFSNFKDLKRSGVFLPINWGFLCWRIGSEVVVQWGLHSNCSHAQRGIPQDDISKKYLLHHYEYKLVVCRRSRTMTPDMRFTSFCRSYSCSSVGKSRDLNAGAVDAFVTSDYQQCFGCLGSVSNSLLHWLQSDQSFHSSTSFLTHFLTVTHFFWHSDFNSSALVVVFPHLLHLSLL